MASTYYVAPTGSDTAAGTEAAPFASWAHAQSAAAAGDTVYFRGGTYKYTESTSTCSSGTATVDAITLTKSGASGSPIRYWAYPGEKPVFDFSGISDTSKYSCRHVGVRIAADWLYLKGLEFTGTLQLNMLNHESWGVYIDGGNSNIFELLDSHHHMGPGFFLVRGGNNLFLNCDSHENEDTLTSNGDGQSADGFGCHPNQQSGGSGNVFRGCRSWWNSDDSWDFINAQDACTVEYSWAWYSGYKPDAIQNGQPVSLPAGNGNGFKSGGYGDPQTKVPTPTPQHTVRFNVAFYNKVNGVYANHEIVSPFIYNNTSFNNGTDFDMLGLNGTTVTSVGTLRNNIAFSTNGRSLLANMTNGGPISSQNNSWDTSTNVTVTAADFQSIAFTPPASCPAPFSPGGKPCIDPTDMKTFAGMASARQADGSLPVLPFLRLAANSPLIDRGVDVGLPYVGKAPDLGAFETGGTYDGSDAGPSTGGASGSSGSTSGGDDASVTPDDGGSGSGSGSASSTGLSGSTGSSGDTTGTASGTGGAGAPGDVDASSGPSGASGASGSASSTGASTSGTAFGNQDAGSSSSGGGDQGSSSGGSSNSSGCSVRAAGGVGDAPLMFGGAVLALVLARRRRGEGKRA